MDDPIKIWEDLVLHENKGKAARLKLAIQGENVFNHTLLFKKLSEAELYIICVNVHSVSTVSSLSIRHDMEFFKAPFVKKKKKAGKGHCYKSQLIMLWEAYMLTWRHSPVISTQWKNTDILTNSLRS